jgi:hypothetical protein
LQRISQPDRPREKSEVALLIDFITRPAPEPKPSKAVPLVADKRSPRIAVSKTATGKSLTAVPSTSEHRQPAMAAIPQFYNNDGSVHVPAEVLADLAKLRGDTRNFDFQMPGIERADAMLQHRAPLEYRATRFDKDWRPTQDLLTDVLTRAVEATTKEVRIPIPGDPRHHIVCKVSLLALGGACGVEGNGDPDALLPGHDDPDTLSAEEDRACQAWWEKIISAKTQDEWRQTRRLYDLECRKPLAREDLMPETIKAPSGP